MLDRLRDIVLFVAGIIAVGALILAAYEGFNQRVTSASFLGALGVVCVFMLFMPKLEVFKVWGIEARLVKTLDRAEEILAKLQRLSLISAKATAMNLAWGNRMATPPAREKQSILDEMDAQLAELNVSPEDRRAVTKTYVQIIGFDFYQIYVRTLRSYGGLRLDKLIARMNATQAPEHREVHEAHIKGITEWDKQLRDTNLFARLSAYKLDDELKKAAPTQWLSGRELEIALAFRDEIVRLFDESKAKGGFTPAAAEFYDKYETKPERKAHELFDDVLNEIK